MASGLSLPEKKAQVNILIYAMGDEADDILWAFALTDEHRKENKRVKGKFDEHFVPHCHFRASQIQYDASRGV